MKSDDVICQDCQSRNEGEIISGALCCTRCKSYRVVYLEPSPISIPTVGGKGGPEARRIGGTTKQAKL